MDAEQDLAASKMAAAQRGRQARKDAQEQKEAASKVAAMQKGKNARKQKKEEDKASVAIQSRYRGKRERAKTNTVRFEGTQRYYTPAEVGAHNRFDDLWVSFFGKVCNLTSLVASNPGHLVTPIIEAAGTDISHWFDPVTKQVRTFIDPETEFEMPYTPMGVFLHCPPPRPTADWNSDIGTPWWKDKKLSIGQLTAKTRKITLFNMLTKQSTTLEVCTEETLEEIQRRYLQYNGHSASYTWKHTDKENGTRLLKMRDTLDANGIPDEDLKFNELSIDPDTFVPIIHLYFSDDLTVA